MAKPAHLLLVTTTVCLWACAPDHLVDTPDAGQAASADAGYSNARDSSVELPVDGTGEDATAISDGGDGGRSSLDPCGVPDATWYACPGEPTDAGACLGPPLHYGGFTLPPDLIDDASHPVGCIATLPYCNPISNDTGPASCFCAAPQTPSNPGDAAAWSCPL